MGAETVKSSVATPAAQEHVSREGATIMKAPLHPPQSGLQLQPAVSSTCPQAKPAILAASQMGDNYRGDRGGMYPQLHCGARRSLC